MKHVFLFLLFIVLPIKYYSQDTIVLRTGEDIYAKVLQVDDELIQYKKWTYQDGPTFTVSKEKVFMIKYADGSRDVFREYDYVDSQEDDYSVENESEYGQNIIAINPFSFFLGNFSMSYERINASGKFGLRIPFNVPVFANVNNQAGLNLDFKFYPWGQGKARYYLGPSVAVYGYDGHLISGIMFDNGVSFQPFNAFNITLDGAIGFADSPERYAHMSKYKLDMIIFRGGISFGIRF